MAKVEFEIGYTKSNMARRCHTCGNTIPARKQSVKHSKRVRGSTGAGAKYSKNVTFYTCMECEKPDMYHAIKNAVEVQPYDQF